MMVAKLTVVEWRAFVLGDRDASGYAVSQDVEIRGEVKRCRKPVRGGLRERLFVLDPV